jgi:beta-glucosidase
VLLKNKNNVLPLQKGTKVYIPERIEKGKIGFFGNLEEDKHIIPYDKEQIAPYLTVVDTPEEADVALVMMESPQSLGYNDDERLGDTGYLPINLQYRPYTAAAARAQSIGQGDYRETEDPNRSYRGKTGVCYNEKDLDNVLEMRRVMGDKPVISVLTISNMTVPAEFEPYVDGLVVNFVVQPQAIYQILTGEAEPSALLPAIMPASMETVEAHCEDLPFDITPYTDSEGNCYDFGFGMNWSGVIHDARGEKYNKENAVL